jgi:hypothetical protein
MTESAVPANNMGSGEGISTFDPILIKKPVKRLRDIIGKSELKKEKSRGI